MFTFTWIPDGRWRGEAAYVTALYADPNAVRPAVSVQGAWNRSGGIIRGLKERGALIEDHTLDLLDDDSRLRESETRIFGANDMRAQVWTGRQHVAAYRQAHPGQWILAWTGNGNLLQNPHFIAYVGASERGILYCLKSELQYLGTDGRSYTCLVVRRAGYAPEVSIERLRFEDTIDGPCVYSERGEEITAEVEYATYGQMLVENGAPITDEDLIRMARCQEFYDLRHLFLFGRLRLAQDRWIDAGLSGFWSAQGAASSADSVSDCSPM